MAGMETRILIGAIIGLLFLGAMSYLISYAETVGRKKADHDFPKR